ncbi:MAG: GMC family oxidoreductase, partial [Gemmatimonadales bacterium]|nr:GMC family oxidoreductase [Gemmatimonadales bacterium]
MTAYDTIIIGSGFGGSMAAHTLVHAGQRVLLVERGEWVRRGANNWRGEEVGQLCEHYHTDAPYLVQDDAGRSTAGACFCVGGPSVFYGGVALRLRQEDFESDPDIDANSGAAWPYAYADLEPWYSAAERIIGVAGLGTEDPTEPWRSGPYSEVPAPLSDIARRIGDAARGLGFHPFRLPLAINYGAVPGRPRCTSCGTCDGFACAISAKNDLATSVLPGLV